MKKHKLLTAACLWGVALTSNASEEIKLSCIGVVSNFYLNFDGSTSRLIVNDGKTKQVNVIIKKEPVTLKSKEKDWVAYFGRWSFYYDRNPLSHNWIDYSDYKNLEYNFLWVDEDSIKGEHTFDESSTRDHYMTHLEINRVTGEFNFYDNRTYTSTDNKKLGEYYSQEGTCKKSTHKF